MLTKKEEKQRQELSGGPVVLQNREPSEETGGEDTASCLPVPSTPPSLP